MPVADGRIVTCEDTAVAGSIGLVLRRGIVDAAIRFRSGRERRSFFHVLLLLFSFYLRTSKALCTDPEHNTGQNRYLVYSRHEFATLKR